MAPRSDATTTAGSWVPPGTARHPMLRLVADLGAQVDVALRSFDPELLSVDDKRDLLLGLTRLTQRTELLRGRVLLASTEVAAQPGARNAVAWLAEATGTLPGAHHRAIRLAERLQCWTLVKVAVEDGRVNPDQAHAIVSALDALLHPAVDLGDDRDEIIEQAQRLLIAEAATKTPAELKALGSRILDLVAPILGETEEAKRLAREEAKAAAGTHLHLFDLGNGLTRIEGHLPHADALRLQTLLEAYTNPRRPCSCGVDDEPSGRPTVDPFAHAKGCAAHASSPSCRAPGDVRDAAQRRGAALCQLLHNIDPTTVPNHGGDSTTLIVTITLDDLLAKLGVGALEDGTGITAAQARRMACAAGIIPAVLGGESEVLDLGRTSRVFSPAQRRALGLQRKTCQARGCTIPSRWCDAHHEQWWIRDRGSTNLDNASLLCAFHHHRVHDTTYAHHRHADGSWTFTRIRQ